MTLTLPRSRGWPLFEVNTGVPFSALFAVYSAFSRLPAAKRPSRTSVFPEYGDLAGVAQRRRCTGVAAGLGPGAAYRPPEGAGRPPRRRFVRPSASRMVAELRCGGRRKIPRPATE